MSIESLTYAELGDRLGASPEAARSLARRLRLTRRPAMMERCESPSISPRFSTSRCPPDHRAVTGGDRRLERARRATQGELARLEVEKQCLEARAAGHRADFERERERCDTLMTETLKLGNLAMSAREKAARLEGELSAAWTRRRWWRRLIARCGANPARAEEPGKAQYSQGVPVRIRPMEDGASDRGLVVYFRLPMGLPNPKEQYYG